MLAAQQIDEFASATTDIEDLPGSVRHAAASRRIADQRPQRATTIVRTKHAADDLAWRRRSRPLVVGAVFGRVIAVHVSDRWPRIRPDEAAAAAQHRP